MDTNKNAPLRRKVERLCLSRLSTRVKEGPSQRVSSTPHRRLSPNGSHTRPKRRTDQFGAGSERSGRLRPEYRSPTHGPGGTPLPSDGSCNFVLPFSRTLFINGQATDQTVTAAERLGRALGLRANLMARWGELQLQSDSKVTPFFQVPADPAGVDMDRVASTMRAIEDVESGRLAPDAAMKAISRISRTAPRAPTPFEIALE